jgi:hypothetical protein
MKGSNALPSLRVKNKRMKITAVCSKLTGENKEDKQQIRDTLELAYTIRNAAVHGEDSEKRLEDDYFLDDLIEEVEDILRKTIKKQVKNF